MLSNFLENFKRFKVFFVNNIELEKEVFRIRYQVYCEEFGYEQSDQFTTQMERDIYDTRSVYCLVQDSYTKTYVGCVRLVLPERNNLASTFPLENICSEHILDFHSIPRNQFAEISRLAIIAQFRNYRVMDKISNVHLLKDKKSFESSFPIVTLIIYLSSISMLEEMSIKYGLALMAPKLARHIRMIGITSRPIGSKVEFHGQRVPFILNTSEIVDNFSQRPEIYHLFKQVQVSIRENISRNFLIA